MIASTAPQLDLDRINQTLQGQSPPAIIQWAADQFGDRLVLSTSFGIQSAVMLHLVTSVLPEIPVVWVDTGYLPDKTYLFAEQLTERLRLNLKVYQSPISPARMEALYGKLWESDRLEDFNRYDQMRKVEPMQRALRELGATAWLAGLRRQQTEHRQNLGYVAYQGSYHRIYPILDWHSRDVYNYLQEHNLPYHPLFDEGYVTVGDWHSSRPLLADDQHERDTRFRGLKQECGLHLPQSMAEEKSLNSSGL